MADMRELEELAREVRKNIKLLGDCPRHAFPEGQKGRTVRDRLTCLNCGGQMDVLSVGAYVRGYIAAGGTPSDILPDWA